MTMTLYTRNGTGAFPVDVALAMAGAEYKAVAVNTDAKEQAGAAFTTINPMQQVPALVLADGTVITESVAMLLHLADLYPSAGLAPPAGSPGAARFLRWMVFMTVNLYEADLRYFYTERYTDAAGLPGTKAAAAAHMARCFKVMEDHSLSPFVCGETFSIADVYLAMLTTWSPEPVTLPRIASLVASVKAHPIVAPIWIAHAMD